MKAVILAGGLGTRISEETGSKPKPMINIGGRPILWHIMKIYAAHGIKEFVLCLGYKGYCVKEYFSNYFLHSADVTIDLSRNSVSVHSGRAEDWRVTLVDTGVDTMTGGRLKRVRHYVANDTFCLTYGDGVADIDVTALLTFHKAHRRQASVTAVRPPGRFGALNLGEANAVSSFVEKPEGDGSWINGGFFVLEPEVIDLIDGDDTIFEQQPLKTLATNNQLSAFHHRGFWQPMDTLRDMRFLEDLWSSGRAPLVHLVIFWNGRRVLVIGNTGFKGAWLSLWLRKLGAVVHGLALEPPTAPSLWRLIGGADLVPTELADIRDPAGVARAFARAAPEIVFHLAAQALVQPSYDDPAGTFATNVMGTVNVLEGARRAPGMRAFVNVTSDKCYENREQIWPYRESDPMGGADPYSASKGCAELVTSSWRKSFYAAAEGPFLASARAGNVIGGGDWSPDRLIPDCLRAFAAAHPVRIRNPRAVRPWQHVLEPLSGYLLLAQKLHEQGQAVAEGWNFGPSDEDAWPVHRVVEHFAQLWGDGARWAADTDRWPPESLLLRVDATKARLRLGWTPRLTVAEALAWTAAWHRAHANGADLRSRTLDQIAAYEALGGAGP